MLQQILVIFALLAFAFLLLSVGVIFRKDHKFHAQDVGASKAMRDRGIHCTKTQDAIAQHRAKTKKLVL